ncbi:MAG: polyprenyl synthetase family protein [Spirochaetaceae bacterium]|jgi:octaprenyl-diphosphate synthase|nr:polyprenyl synthetase family protein [Spirochaetaceae bacterium]
MDREYTTELQKIEASLNKTLPQTPDASWWVKMFPNISPRPELARELLEPGLDLFSRGGKRWRPLLAHLICQALGGGDAAIPLLGLVEFPHNASLIHDDLEDESTERRGKAAIHLLYGNDTAINSGSFLYFLPFMDLENWNGEPQAQIRIWKLYAAHLRLLHLGQSMDIAWHRDPAFTPSLEDYMLMCGLKTGCLARFAALLGAEIAGAVQNTIPDESLTASLGEAAQKLGVGFQILDDVKNLSTGIPGKTRGDDVVEGKKSLPVLLFLHGSGTGPDAGVKRIQRAEFVSRCFMAAKAGGATVPEVEALAGALEEAGILAEAERQGKALINQAGAFFSELPAENAGAKKLLTGLTERLL